MAIKFLNTVAVDTDVLYVDATNDRVGIGTTSPDYLFEVEKTTLGSATLASFKNTENTSIRISRTGASSGTSIFNVVNNGALYTSSDSHIVFQPGNSTSVFLQNTGNVGIGTTSPYNKTHIITSVDGDGLLLDYSGGNDNKYVGVFFKIDNNTSDAYKKGALVWERTGGYNEGRFHFLLNNDDNASNVDLTDSKVTILSTGNVGIGTTSPAAPLHVLNDSSANVLAKIRIQGDSASGYGDIGMQSGYIRLFSNGSMCSAWTGGVQYNYINGSTATTLTSTGLGINTTSPDFRLDVDGTFGVSDLPFNTDSVSVLVADETTGVEEVTNGSFTTDADWNKNSNWTISGGTANADGTSNNDMNQIPVNGYPAVGEVFRVSFEVTARTQGQVRIIYGGASTAFVTVVGKYEYIITATTTDRIRIQCNGSFIGSVDNLSIKQITSASNQIQKRELGTGAFGPTPVGAYLPLAGGTMTGNIVLNDNIQLQLGSTADLRIYSNGTDNYINNINGHLNIRNNANDKDIYFQNDNGTGGYSTYFYLDGSLTNGTTTLGATRFPDNSKIFMGTGGDLVFNHDGTHSYITNNTGDFTIENAGDDLILKSADDFLAYVQGTDIAIQAIGDGKVGLRYNNVEKFQTISTGIGVTGDIQIDSALLSNQENTDVDTGTETVANVSITDYTAAFFDFVIKKTTNVRSGTVYACHDGTNVEFTETSTNDLGDTSDVTLSVDISGTNMRLLATVTSDDWSVKSLIRAI